MTGDNPASPAPPHILAESAGRRLVAHASELHLVELGTRGGSIAAYVLALVGGLTTVNGLVFATAAPPGTGPGPGLLLLAIGVTALALLAAVLRANRRKRAQHLDLPLVAVFDLAEGELRAPDGRHLAPIAAVRLQRQMQLASSSYALAARWPGGSLVIARGSPFAGSIAPFEDALRAAGVDARSR